MKASWVLICVCGLAACATGYSRPRSMEPGPMAAGGEYRGQYGCGTTWTGFTLELGEGNRGQLSGGVRFDGQLYPPQNGLLSRMTGPNRRIGEPATVRGSADAPGRIQLTTAEEIMLAYGGPEVRVTMEARMGADGVWSGTLDYPGCGQVFMAPTDSAAAGRRVISMAQSARRQAQQAASATAAQQRELEIEERRVERKTTGWIPPELRMGGGVWNPSDGLLEYSDAYLRSPGGTQPGIRPVDVTHQRLFDDGHKCLATATVAWNAETGSAQVPLFGSKKYVIDCDGDCEGLRYAVQTQSRVLHGGATSDAPLITIQRLTLGDAPVGWYFRRPDPTRPAPVVRVHVWTDTLGDYGPGCRMEPARP